MRRNVVLVDIRTHTSTPTFSIQPKQSIDGTVWHNLGSAIAAVGLSVITGECPYFKLTIASIAGGSVDAFVWSVETATAVPTAVSSPMGVRTSLCGMLVGKLAMVMSCRRVLFGLFVLANRVMVRRLMVMMRRGMVVTGRRVMMPNCRMTWCLCHFSVPPFQSVATKSNCRRATELEGSSTAP
jgi:hypothetical protein